MSLLFSSSQNVILLFFSFFLVLKFTSWSKGQQQGYHYHILYIPVLSLITLFYMLVKKSKGPPWYKVLGVYDAIVGLVGKASDNFIICFVSAAAAAAAVAVVCCWRASAVTQQLRRRTSKAPRLLPLLSTSSCGGLARCLQGYCCGRHVTRLVLSWTLTGAFSALKTIAVCNGLALKHACSGNVLARMLCPAISL